MALTSSMGLGTGSLGECLEPSQNSRHRQGWAYAPSPGIVPSPSPSPWATPPGSPPARGRQPRLRRLPPPLRWRWGWYLRGGDSHPSNRFYGFRLNQKFGQAFSKESLNPSKGKVKCADP